MEPSLKPVKSEMRLQEVADQEVLSSTTSTASLRARDFGAVSAAQGTSVEAVKAAKMQVGFFHGKASEASAYVRGSAAGNFSAGKDKLAEASARVKTKASRFAEPISGSFTRVAGAAQVAKEAALAYVCAAQDAVSRCRRSIEQTGLRPWTIDTASNIREFVGTAFQGSKGRGRAAYEDVSASALTRLQQAREDSSTVFARAKAKAEELAAKAGEVVSGKSFQTVAVSATGGAVVLGVGGAAAGLGVGSAVGAAIGLVPALLTFGLSIPIGAAVGGTAGLCLGAVAGATAGAVGGGAAGFGAYVRKDDIGGMAVRTASKVSDSAEYVKTKAYASAAYVKEQASVVRARLDGSSTGGTAD